MPRSVGNLLDEDVKKTEQRIDEIVYELCGLSSNDVKLIADWETQHILAEES